MNCYTGHGQISEPCWAKEARYKREYSVDFHLHWNSRSGPMSLECDKKNRLASAQGQQWGWDWLTLHVRSCGKTEMFLTLVLVVVTQVYVFVKNSSHVLLWVHFIVYKWYFSEIDFSFNVKGTKPIYKQGTLLLVSSSLLCIHSGIFNTQFLRFCIPASVPGLRIHLWAKTIMLSTSSNVQFIWQKDINKKCLSKKYWKGAMRAYNTFMLSI